MRNKRYTARTPRPAGDSLTLVELEGQLLSWHLDCEIRQLSKGTLANRKMVAEKLLWFLQQRELDQCGPHEMRLFLAYLNTAHEKPEGRWGDARRRKPMRPQAARFWWKELSAFWSFAVEQEAVAEHPMAKLRPPIIRQDQPQPLTEQQMVALFQAARKGRNPRRDEAILWVLVDTGLRASEVCSLRVKDVDVTTRRATVIGKGNKRRAVCLGAAATKALFAYLKEQPRDPDEFLFASGAGRDAGEPMTRSGLLQLIRRLGKRARIEGARLSPHTLRHTFAVEFLRGGGHQFSLQELMGHTSVAMTRKYVMLAQSDIENQHRQFSPGDRLKKAMR
jgi:site-specific recombinase XerD